MEYWKIGILEYWKVGLMGKHIEETMLFASPTFHYAIIPLPHVSDTKALNFTFKNNTRKQHPVRRN